MAKVQEIYAEHPAERYLPKGREPVIQKLVLNAIAHQSKEKAARELREAAGPATKATKGPFNHGEDEES